MKREDILKDLRKLVTPYVHDEESLKTFSEKSDFITSLEINSANIVDLILDIEIHYDIQLSNEAIEKIFTIEDTINAITEQLDKR